jgi:hypothetical protein
MISTILSDIETAMLCRLKDKGLEVTRFTVSDLDDDAGAALIKCPAVNVSFAGVRDIVRVSKSTYKFADAAFAAVLIAKNVRSEEALRRAVYPILMGCVGILTDKKLTVSDPEPRVLACRELQPGRITKAFESPSHIAFQTVFTTSFNYEVMDDDEAGELITIGLQYYLKPGDDVLDAETIMTTTEE